MPQVVHARRPAARRLTRSTSTSAAVASVQATRALAPTAPAAPQARWSQGWWRVGSLRTCEGRQKKKMHQGETSEKGCGLRRRDASQTATQSTKVEQVCSSPRMRFLKHTGLRARLTRQRARKKKAPPLSSLSRSPPLLNSLRSRTAGRTRPGQHPGWMRRPCVGQAGGEKSLGWGESSGKGACLAVLSCLCPGAFVIGQSCYTYFFNWRAGPPAPRRRTGRPRVVFHPTSADRTH